MIFARPQRLALSFRRNFFNTQQIRQRYYTKDHEWLTVNGNIGTFGITDYAQKALGDVVYIEVPSVGDEVGQSGMLDAY
jgi:glycine cleavage system H lipoate-binding protein